VVDANPVRQIPVLPGSHQMLLDTNRACKGYFFCRNIERIQGLWVFAKEPFGTFLVLF
jgi:hypothetical protein